MKRNYISRIVVSSILALVLLVSIALFFSFTAINKINDYYLDILRSQSQSISEILSSKLEKCEGVLGLIPDSISADSVPEGCSAYIDVVFSASGDDPYTQITNARIRFADSQELNEYVTSDSPATRSLIKYDRGVLKLSSIFTDYLGEDKSYYYVKTAFGSASRNIVLLFDLDEFFSDLPFYDLTTLMLCGDNGTVYYGTDLDEKSKISVLPSRVSGDIVDNNAFTSEASLGGVNGIFALSSPILSGASETSDAFSLRIAGFVSNDKFAEMKFSLVFIGIVFPIVMVLIVFGGFLYAVFVYVNRKDSLHELNDDKNYVVLLDKKGRFLSANDAFNRVFDGKQFETAINLLYTNIANTLKADGGIVVELDEKRPDLETIDKDKIGSHSKDGNKLYTDAATELKSDDKAVKSDDNESSDSGNNGNNSENEVASVTENAESDENTEINNKNAHSQVKTNILASTEVGAEKEKANEYVSRRRILLCMPFWNRIGYKIVAVDSTEHYDEYRQLVKNDIHDPETGFLLQKVLDKRIEERKNEKDDRAGLAVEVRIDNIESVRMMYGKNGFSIIIAKYSEILRSTFARYGEIFMLENGDSLVYCRGSQKTKDLVKNISVLMNTLSTPFKVEKELIKFDVYFGAVIINAEEDTVLTKSVLSYSFLALKNALGTSSRYYVMRPAGFGLTGTDFLAKGAIEDMLNAGEYDMFFQPQVRSKTERICGFEALLRITSQKSKEISTAELISVAEQYGGMRELGRFAYLRAMEFARSIEGSGITVSVNVSPVQLMHGSFVDDFIADYDSFGLKEGSLAIEITENAVIHSFSDIIRKLVLLREHGIYTHVDDFGVAYSNLLYIKAFPVSGLKVDKSLIDDIEVDKDATTIVRSLISMSKELNIETIAEGVETKGQRDMLLSYGCDIIQGYFYGKPVSFDAALELVRAQNETPIVEEPEHVKKKKSVK